MSSRKHRYAAYGLFVAAAGGLAAPPPPIRRVVVAGGCHGNEYSGIYMLRQLERNADDVSARYPSLTVETLVANIQAHDQNRRFILNDLNRLFSAESLAVDPPADSYETERARMISHLLGPKGAWRGEAGDGESADLCIDLHTTTSHMGCTLIIPAYCAPALAAAAYVQQRWEAGGAEGVAQAFPLRILIEDWCDQVRAHPPPCRSARPVGHARAARPHKPWAHSHLTPPPPLDQMSSPYLSSAARNGLEVEIGPVPQGLLRADAIGAFERAVYLLLEYFELRARGEAPESPAEIEAYVARGKLCWPDSGEGQAPAGRLEGHAVLGAGRRQSDGPAQQQQQQHQQQRAASGRFVLPSTLVHASLQGRDYCSLSVGDPLWRGPDGETIVYDGSKGETITPIFVNEAAYYEVESGLGIGICEPVRWPLTQPAEG